MKNILSKLLDFLLKMPNKIIDIPAMSESELNPNPVSNMMQAATKAILPKVLYKNFNNQNSPHNPSIGRKSMPKIGSPTKGAVNESMPASKSGPTIKSGIDKPNNNNVIKIPMSHFDMFCTTCQLGLN
jgi:hypothetical protein